MPIAPELSVILTTYQRPRNLERSLASLAMQRGIDGRFELIVADDGSTDETHELVRRFAETVDFPVKLTTHPHQNFWAGKCRNDGVRASRGEYLLFCDGDCVLPLEHLATHLRVRKAGVVWAGNCYRLEREVSQRIDVAAVRTGRYRGCESRSERKRLRRLWVNNWFYNLIRHPKKPKLDACDFGICRRDFEAVNGFDESFVGWGCEDDDFGQRLRRSGVRIESILRHTRLYHLWHDFDPTYPKTWKGGANVDRLLAADRPARCVQGLVQEGDKVKRAG